MRTRPAGRIVVPVTASRTIDRLAEEHGFQVTRSRGHAAGAHRGRAGG